jgi:hypothetical protein
MRTKELTIGNIETMITHLIQWGFRGFRVSSIAAYESHQYLKTTSSNRSKHIIPVVNEAEMMVSLPAGLFPFGPRTDGRDTPSHPISKKSSIAICTLVKPRSRDCGGKSNHNCPLIFIILSPHGDLLAPLGRP